ncbi:tetratricopeptide repeat protein [Ancylostoma ceylanicum]|uniref:Tetratricopeptide repeat protein n=1 Tax=Ancylostoma ceylanicum TaxID=53326 RepID=A0A0D6L5L6_9BILA|nr:tetratricopeptide repeat protein [Ancylostoma ceylanicum]
MKFLTAIILVLGLIFSSCGTKKSVQKDNSSKKGKQQERVHSQADFPYIEAFHNGMRLKIKGDKEGAIEAFQKCLVMKQDDDAVYYALAQLYTEKEDLSQAIQMITKAHQIDPKNIWYTEELAILHYDTRQFEKAIPYFKKLVDHEPKNLSWLYGYGDCLLRTGKVDESIQEKEALAELDAILIEFPKEPQIIATMVDHYFKKGNMDKGVEFLQKLVEADPSNGRAHLALGEIYRQKGKTNEAFKEYKAAFLCEDVDADTKMSLLISLQETPEARAPETMELVDMMVAEHPDDAKSYSIKGDYLMAKDDEQGALESYRKALEFEKKQFPIWHQDAIRLDTESNLLKNNFAYRLANAKTDLELALSLIDQAIERSPQQYNYYDTKGWIYFRMGKYEEALKEMNKAFELDETQHLIVEHIGDVYAKMNQKDKAVEYWEKAVKLGAKGETIEKKLATRAYHEELD